VREVNAERVTLRKYFEKTGCLLTANGTGDHLIHFPNGIQVGNLAKVTSEPSGAELNEPEAVARGEHKREAVPDEGKEEKVTDVDQDDDEEGAQVDDDELDLADEDDEDAQLKEVALHDVIPDGWEMVLSPPDVLDTRLVGQKLAMRWTVTGWTTATVRRFYRRPKGPKEFNYELKWTLVNELRDQRLQLPDYTVLNGAPAGGWCLLQKAVSSKSTGMSLFKK